MLGEQSGCVWFGGGFVSPVCRNELLMLPLDDSRVTSMTSDDASERLKLLLPLLGDACGVDDVKSGTDITEPATGGDGALRYDWLMLLAGDVTPSPNTGEKKSNNSGNSAGGTGDVALPGLDTLTTPHDGVVSVAACDDDAAFRAAYIMGTLALKSSAPLDDTVALL